jgi:hypothetical protein
LSSRNSQLLCRFLMLGVCRNLVQKPAEEVPSCSFLFDQGFDSLFDRIFIVTKRG